MNIENILDELTLEEKVSLLEGKNFQKSILPSSNRLFESLIILRVLIACFAMPSGIVDKIPFSLQQVLTAVSEITGTAVFIYQSPAFGTLTVIK